MSLMLKAEATLRFDKFYKSNALTQSSPALPAVALSGCRLSFEPSRSQISVNWLNWLLLDGNEKLHPQQPFEDKGGYSCSTLFLSVKEWKSHRSRLLEFCTFIYPVSRSVSRSHVWLNDYSVFQQVNLIDRVEERKCISNVKNITSCHIKSKKGR